MEIEVIESDYYYHIYNRGINRQPIFQFERHYSQFLQLCEEYLTRHADVLSYCLIPNHFHLVLYIHPDGVEKGIRNLLSVLFNAYAQWFNKRNQRTGGLFQSPFKRKKLITQEYLLQAIYYTHRNPLHHGLTEKPQDYRYSSFQMIVNDYPTFINKSHVFQLFDGLRNFTDFHKMQFELDCQEYFDEEI